MPLDERIRGRAGVAQSLTSRHRTGAPLSYLHRNHAVGLPSIPNRTHFGTLVTLDAQVTAERDGGTALAMIEPGWDVWEPTDGAFSSSYATSIATKATNARAAGQRITMALGIHNTPGWVGGLTNGHYVNQAGGVSGEANTVFNQTIRLRIERYLDQMHAAVDFSQVWAIRITSGADGELLLPDGAYWAYDVNAQNGADRPPTMSLCPYPGWVPGNTSITTTQVREWIEWYIGCLADCVSWQMEYFRGKGFRGYFQLLTPGSGMRPSDYENEIANRLSPVNGLLGRGAAWHELYRQIRDKNRCMVYVSSMGDGSGSDDNSSLPADDIQAVSSTTMNSWSAVRFQTRIAREYGMLIAGENVGYNSPPAFNTKYADTGTNGMMEISKRQWQGSNMLCFYWAHSERLWPSLQVIAFSEYQTRIQAQNGVGTRVIPGMPI